MLLAGKSIVVTGGNSGIGESIVVAAAAEGANVVVDYVTHPEEATALIARVEAAGGRAVGVRADVSKAADLQAMIQAAVDTYGRLDVLINNAGIETRTSLLDTTEADFDKVVAVNMKSAFFGTQAAARQFIVQGGGGLRAEERTLHVDGHDLVEVGLRGVQQRCARLDTGVVDQHVEPAVGVHRCLDHGLQIGRLRDVSPHPHGSAARGFH